MVFNIFGAAEHGSAGADSADDVIDLAKLLNNLAHGSFIMGEIVVLVGILIRPEAIRNTF
ncbi:hypothetical protein D3C85_1804020 [compost metagenome]